MTRTATLEKPVNVLRVRVGIERETAILLVLTKAAQRQMETWEGEQFNTSGKLTTVDGDFCRQIKEEVCRFTHDKTGQHFDRLKKSLNTLCSGENAMRIDTLLEELLSWSSLDFRSRCHYSVREHAGASEIRNSTIVIFSATNTAFIKEQTLLEPRGKTILCVSGRYGDKKKLTDCAEFLQVGGIGKWEFFCRNNGKSCHIKQKCRNAEADAKPVKGFASDIMTSAGSFFEYGSSTHRLVPVCRAAEAFNILRYLVKSFNILVENSKEDFQARLERFEQIRAGLPLTPDSILQNIQTGEG